MDTALSFGALGTLPLELRLRIWEYLFSFSSCKPNQMAILRANRAIYQETSYFLYDIIDVSISPSDCHTVAMSPRRLGVWWNLDHQHAKRLRFERLPYRRIQLVVHLYAPSGPAELVLLWQKVNTLVDILRNRACFRRLDIMFKQYQGQDWQWKGKAKESIYHPLGIRPDHDIVFMPFCYLENVRSMTITPSSPEMDNAVDWRFINYGRDSVFQKKKRNDRSTYLGDPNYVGLVRIFDNIESLILDTKFFLDTKLDSIPGHLANMLRLKRYATWFPDGECDKSPYQEYILTVLRDYAETAKTYDRGLRRLFTRFNWLVSHHHSLANGDCSQHHIWDHQQWYEKFQFGIAPFTTGQRQKSHLAQLQVSFYRTVYKESSRILSLFYFCCDARRWISRQRKVYHEPARTKYRLGYLRERWCYDCQQTGFIYGCHKCRHKVPYKDVFK